MKSRITIFLLALFVTQLFKIALAEENSPDVKTVISEGVGIDPQNAAQNAAENALKQIVGSFMDSSTLLEKRTLIDSGIKSETKSISSDIKEYSQGSIKSFETVEVKPEGGLYKVTAKVTVRNENFSVYIKKLAQGETKIDGTGMFAQISNELDQKNNLVKILIDAVSPIKNGEVQSFNVQPPLLLTQVIKNRELLNELEGYDPPHDNRFSRGFIARNGKGNTIVIKVSTKLNPPFLKHLNETLKEISNYHFIENIQDEAYNGLLQFSSEIKEKISSESMCIAITKEHFGKNFNAKQITDFYIFNNIKNNFFLNFEKIKTPAIKVAISDKNNKVIFIGNDLSFHLKVQEHDELPWLLIRKKLSCNLLISEGNTFYIALEVNEDTLKEAHKVFLLLGDIPVEITSNEVKNTEDFKNPNTVSSKYQPTEDKQVDKFDKNSNPEISKSKSTENSKNTEKSENNLKLEAPKSEKSTKQLQILKTNAVTNIKQKMNSNWNGLIKNADFSLLNPESVSKFKCVVVATLSSDGNVTDVALKESSGYGGFDSIAENSVKKSSPLPIAKDDDLFDSSFKTMTFIFDKNNVEVQTLN